MIINTEVNIFLSLYKLYIYIQVYNSAFYNLNFFIKVVCFNLEIFTANELSV